MKKLLIAIMLVSCSLMAQDAPKKQCKGITSKGAPCKSIMIMQDGYCRAHSPSTLRCNAKKSDGKHCRMPVSEINQHCHLHQLTTN